MTRVITASAVLGATAGITIGYIAAAWAWARASGEHR